MPLWLQSLTKSGLPLLVLLILLRGGMADAKAYTTKDEALKTAFPGAKIEKKRIFLTKEDVKKIEKLSGTKLSSRMFTYYRAFSEEGPAGYAVIDKHTVRTKPEVYMVVIKPDLSVSYIKILAFYEPGEYKPMERWLAQFSGKSLSERLWIKRDIQAISGATITSYTLTRQIRKVLATMELMLPKVVK